MVPLPTHCLSINPKIFIRPPFLLSPDTCHQVLRISLCNTHGSCLFTFISTTTMSLLANSNHLLTVSDSILVSPQSILYMATSMAFNKWNSEPSTLLCSILSGFLLLLETGLQSSPGSIHKTASFPLLP